MPVGMRRDLLRIGVQGQSIRVLEVSTGRRAWEGDRLEEAVRFALQERDRFQFDYEDRVLCGVAWWQGYWVGGLLKPEWMQLVQRDAPLLVIDKLIYHPLTQRRNQE